MENSIVWFTSNNPTTTWSILGTLFSFIKLITISNVCNSPCDIHISKNWKCFCCKWKNWQIVHIQCLHDHGKKTFLPKENSEKETKHEGIGVKLISKTKCSYKWVREACNPCKCKIPKFQKKKCGQSFKKRFVAPKNVMMVHKQIDPWFVLLNC